MTPIPDRDLSGEDWLPSVSWLRERACSAQAYLAEVPVDLLGPAARRLRSVPGSALLGSSEGRKLSLLADIGGGREGAAGHQPFLMSSVTEPSSQPR